MMDLLVLAILIGSFLVVISPFENGRKFTKILGKIFFCIVFFPYYIIKWRNRQKAIKERRRNYEILGNYVALLGNNSEILSYFRQLIEKGIKEEKLTDLLENNIRKLQEFEEGKKREEIRAQLEEEHNFQELAAEQKELLVQAQLSLEQIKFREKLLEGLYQKLQKKYRL